MRNAVYLLILIVVSVFIFMYGLGNMALTDPDETFYAQTAKEMLHSDEWGTPMIFGKPQFEKPVLYYVLVRLSYMVFGVNEFAARFPSVIFGVIGVFGIYFLGRFLFSDICGIVSGLIMATSAEYFVLARACVTDMVLAVFILYCFLFFLMGLEKGKKVYFLVSSLMAALAVLTKGPIGVFIPFAVIALYFTFSRQWPAVKKIPLAWSIIIFIAVSVPWYILMIKIHGNALIDEFFGIHNIVRFLEPEHRIGDSPFFYIPVLVGGFFPWSVFLPAGAWYMYKQDTFISRIRAHKLFLSLWFLVVFVFFTASRTKLVTYIFPLFPVMALTAGRFWEVFLKGSGTRAEKAMKISYWTFFSLSLAALAGVYIFIRYEYPQALQGALIAGSVYAAGLLFSAVFFMLKNKVLCFCAIVLTVAVLAVPIVNYILPVIERHETSKAVSSKVKELVGLEDPLGGECDNRRGLAFYTDRTDITDVHKYQDLFDFLSRKERVWCVIQQKHYDQMKGNHPELMQEPVFRSGEKVLVTNNP